MSANVLVPLATGFEEIEAVTIIDVLRRAGLNVTTAALNGDRLVRGSHDICVLADAMLNDVAGQTWAAVVLPGGMPGSRNLAESAQVRDVVRRTVEEGGIGAAVCAAPIALHTAGVLRGRRVTAYPTVRDELTDAVYTGRRVERDGPIVTGLGPGAALEFALAVAEAAGCTQQALDLRKKMMVSGDASAV